MSRRVLTLVLVLAVTALLPAAAQGHPLGNFSVNHLSKVSVSSDRVDVRYVLDQAEIPTVQESGLTRAEVLDRKLAEIRDGLELRVDGRPVALRAGPVALSFPDGAGGLETTRLTVPFTAGVDDPSKVTFSDDTFEGRVGWRAIVSAPGTGTAVRSDAPSGDPTDGLRRYPDDLLSSPLDRREASFSVRPGDGTLVAPRSEGAATATTRAAGDGFASVFDRAASGQGVLALLLLAAFGWGAMHALSPGHGKAMVAAYLVGTRGKPRHAVALGATVTVTHTIGVFALGFVTLALSHYILPEDLYPWLNLLSGLLVVGIGASVLRSRLRWTRDRRAAKASGPAPPDDPGPSADGGRGHTHSHGRSARWMGHTHDHDHTHHGHDHDHTHAHHHTVTRRSLIGLGAAAGLIPCPSALVVLLGAISQHEVGLGLLLITAFSVGLAATLTVLGLAVVYARRLLPRFRMSGARGFGRLASALPAASAVVIVGIGCVLTANALPGLM